MKKKNLGFTLAEVLIVIGIIGVVAALTLPNLNHATGDKERITRVKKAYSNLVEAFDRAQAIYGPFDTWFTDEPESAVVTERFGKRVTEFMKISKDCGAETGCFTSGATKMLSGNNYYSGLDTGFYDVITPDGTAICLSVSSNVNDRGYVVSGSIFIDIDGPDKGAYTWGKDLFYFYLTDNQILPYCNTYSFASLLGNLNTGSQGACAATWILNYDNADYLKIKDSNGTCDNGNVVTESNPSCN